jgi:hypothetical protein
MVRLYRPREELFLVRAHPTVSQFSAITIPAQYLKAFWETALSKPKVKLFASRHMNFPTMPGAIIIGVVDRKERFVPFPTTGALTAVRLDDLTHQLYKPLSDMCFVPYWIIVRPFQITFISTLDTVGVKTIFCLVALIKLNPSFWRLTTKAEFHIQKLISNLGSPCRPSTVWLRFILSSGA